MLFQLNNLVFHENSAEIEVTLNVYLSWVHVQV